MTTHSPFWRHSQVMRPLIHAGSVAMVSRTLLLLWLLCPTARADVYVLGSSYSNDARPPLLDDWPQWHIDCGMPLLLIAQNPLTPCSPESTVWPTALTQTHFDYISFQPVQGTGITQQSDADVIGLWIAMQVDAIAVIHPTWPIPSIFEEVYHDPDADQTMTNYSKLYYESLIEKLQQENPGRIIISDRVNEMLDSIYHDIENGVGPLNYFSEMFFDFWGHSSRDYGQYLQHNALRQAFGQTTGIDNSVLGVEPVVKAYLDAKILEFRPTAIPEPSAPLQQGWGLLMLMALARWRGRSRRRSAVTHRV